MDLHVRAKIIIILEGKVNLYDLELKKAFLDMTLKVQAAKEKNKLDLVKIKTFCISKDTIKKVKRQPKNEEKYLQFIIMI